MTIKKFSESRPAQPLDMKRLSDVAAYYANLPATPWHPQVKTIVKKEKPRLYKEINRRTLPYR